METFADVLHAIIDTVFTGDAADRAHAVIDKTSGTRSEAATVPDDTEPEPAPDPSAVPGADEEAPPTPGG